MRERSNRQSGSRRPILMGGGLALAALMISATAFAWVNPTKTTYLTFKVAVALPGVTLPAGSYIFELAPGHVDVVRVFNRERSTVHFMGLTLSVPRPSGMPASQEIRLGEAPRGTPPPIRVWYPKGKSDGREFIYN